MHRNWFHFAFYQTQLQRCTLNHGGKPELRLISSSLSHLESSLALNVTYPPDVLMAPPSAAGTKWQLRSSWVQQRLWIWECTGTGVSGMAVHRSCTCRGLHTWSCTCSSAELPACGTNNAVIATAAALWPINAPSHTAHPPRIASEHLSETLSKRTGKGNHRSHAKSLEYWIYSLLPALNESSNHNGFWTPSLPTRMQKIKQYFLIHKAISHLIKSKLDSWSNL